jgi:branched-chain amino acid transport system substrate-binding protein
MNKKQIILILSVLLVLVGFVYATNSKHPREELKTIKIGMVYGLTGPASVWTENGKKAAELAVEDINREGGVNGKKIELIIEDSKTDPKGSVSAFQKLTDIDNVDVVIGDVWSFITNPLIPLAESKKVVLLSPTVMNASVEKHSPYFFTIGHTVESQEEAMKKFFAINPDIKTVYDLCWNDAWGKAHSNLLKKVTEELGIKIVGQTCTADFSSDYRTEAIKIKTANPDAVFVTSAYADKAVKALVELKVNKKILTTTDLAAAIRTRDFPLDYTRNVWFMDWIPSQEFMDKFNKRYESYPITEAQNSYEAVRRIANALENNPTDLLKGIKALKYQTVDGEIDFTDSDNITANKAEAKLYSVNSESAEFVEIK